MIAATVPWTHDTVARVHALFENLEILSPAAFRIADRTLSPGEVPPMPLSGIATGWPAEQQILRAALATAIYAWAYSRAYRGGAVPADALTRPTTPDAALAEALSRANPTADGWEPGWRVFQLGPHGALHVQKGEAAVQVQAGQYSFIAGGGARNATVGDPIEVLIRRESAALQPGAYFAFGQTVANDYDFGRIARLYFHTPAAEAPWLLATVGDLLNRHYIAWRFKCPLDPAHFDRADGAVLYLGRRFVPAVLRMLAPLRRDFEGRLLGESPLFAKPLAPGLSAADDPGGGESFGQARSILLADAAIEAWKAGRNDVNARCEALVRGFARAGLRSDMPHLAIGLVDIYDWPRVAEIPEAA